MADPGEIALRMLDPQWSTLHGTVRQWLHRGRMRRLLAESAEHGEQRGEVAIAFGAGVSGGRPVPDETETIVRFWLERAGRSRYEFLSADGRIERTSIDDGRSLLVVPEHGKILRTERGQSSSQGVWTGDPRILTGNVRLRFEHDEVVAGRPAARVETIPVPGEREMVPRYMPPDRGILSGAGGSAIIDAGTGLILRYESRDRDGRPMSRHEFVTIEVDEPIPDEVFSYDIPPERRERTPTEIQLDMLEQAGVDIRDLDPGNPAAVRRAVDEHFRQFRDEQVRQGSRISVPRGRRPLAETVAPLGPPPDDVEASRAQIAEALYGLGPDDEPRAGRVERGEVLDRAGPAREHPVTRGKAVTFELLDVVFLREDEALIEFEVHVSSGPTLALPGRVVRRDGRWLLSYDTVARLRQMGGDPVPSLLDHPDADREPPVT